MTSISKIAISTPFARGALALAFAGVLALAPLSGGCGSPAREDTVTHTSTMRPESGGEVHSTSTETTQTQRDGATTVDTQTSTQRSTPPQE